MIRSLRFDPPQPTLRYARATFADEPERLPLWLRGYALAVERRLGELLAALIDVTPRVTAGTRSGGELFVARGARATFALAIVEEDRRALLAVAFGEKPEKLGPARSNYESRAFEQLIQELIALAVPIAGEVAAIDVTTREGEASLPGSRAFALDIAGAAKATIELFPDESFGRGPGVPLAALLGARVRLDVTLSSQQLSAAALGNLRPGDLLPFDRLEPGSSIIGSGHASIARGDCGESGEQRAFVIRETTP